MATVVNDTIVDLKPAANYPCEAYNPRGCLRGMTMTHQDPSSAPGRPRRRPVEGGDLGRGPRLHRRQDDLPPRHLWPRKHAALQSSGRDRLCPEGRAGAHGRPAGHVVRSLYPGHDASLAYVGWTQRW